MKDSKLTPAQVFGGAAIIEQKYFVAPRRYEQRRANTIFLAGGITGCPEWQSGVAHALMRYPYKLTVFNPRREDFDVNNPLASEQQIEWEHEHLRKADAVLFWFPSESICPITLYELGAYSSSPKPIFVGCDPQYKRRFDVEIQVRLARGGTVTVASSLHELVEQVKDWADLR